MKAGVAYRNPLAMTDLVASGFPDLPRHSHAKPGGEKDKEKFISSWNAPVVDSKSDSPMRFI
jgi:hypothetical protein